MYSFHLYRDDASLVNGSREVQVPPGASPKGWRLCGLVKGSRGPEGIPMVVDALAGKGGHGHGHGGGVACGRSIIGAVPGRDKAGGCTAPPHPLDCGALEKVER